MVDSVYTKAAELIADGTERYNCVAIINAESVENFEEAIDAQEVFDRTFNPKDFTTHWWGFHTTEQSQLARSLALLFLNEMNQDEIPQD